MGIRTLQSLPAELHSAMQEANVEFSDTFLQVYGALGAEIYLRLNRAGFESTDRRVTSEKLLKALLKWYQRIARKLEVS